MAYNHTITVNNESGAVSGVLVQISTDTGLVNVIRSDSTSTWERSHSRSTRAPITPGVAIPQTPLPIRPQSPSAWKFNHDHGGCAGHSDLLRLTAGVMAMVPTIGTLGVSSIPTTAQVITWLQAASAEIDLVLARAGYTTPVANTASAYPMFSDPANLWAAARSLQALGWTTQAGRRKPGRSR